MATLCNDCECRGKKRELWCKHTGEICMFLKYCGVSGHYYQTDAAARCKLKGKDNGKDKT